MSSKSSSLKDAVKTGCRRHMQMFQIFSKSSRSFISPSVFLFIGLLVYFVSLLSLLAAGYRRSFIGRTNVRAPWQKTENKKEFCNRTPLIFNWHCSVIRRAWHAFVYERFSYSALQRRHSLLWSHSFRNNNDDRQTENGGSHLAGISSLYLSVSIFMRLPLVFSSSHWMFEKKRERTEIQKKLFPDRAEKNVFSFA